MSENNTPLDEGSILIPRINLGGHETHHKADEQKGIHHKADEIKETHAHQKTRKKMKKIWKYLFIAFGVFMLFLAVMSVLAYDTYKKGMKLKTSMSNVQVSLKEQDLEKVKNDLKISKADLAAFDNSYSRLALVKILPYFGSFYTDGQHGLKAAAYGFESGDILIDAISPYADLLGFKTKDSANPAGGQTAQERIDFIVKTIPQLIPKSDALSEKVTLVRKELDQIDPDRYPEKFRGKEVRSKLKLLLETVDQASTLLENGKPLLKEADYIMGTDKPRTYLVLFQNDKELRPTGGFLTAYSIAKVEKGRFDPVLSSDIYNLDALYKPRIKAADPIVKYLKGPYTLSPNLRLRDMNWSPDFSKSMDLFLTEAKSAGIKDIDGIISVDTQVLVNLLNVTGPIDVPGFGKFSTNITPECKCPQVIYELESFADVEGPVVWSQDEPGKIIFAPPNYDNRKKIIGPLMNAVLSMVLSQPKEKMPMLAQTIMDSLTEKHILLFMNDKDAQEAVVKFGIGGVLTDYKGDYLFINDANLGGRKSNLYATQDVQQEIEVAKDGRVTKTVTITYKNPEKQDGWLNSVLPNWVRVYVPKGSELISFEGVESKEKPYEDLGKTVFAGYFQLRPQGAAKVTLKYKLPEKFSGSYNIFIQKQPGKGNFRYSIKIGKKLEEFYLKTDKEYKFKI